MIGDYATPQAFRSAPEARLRLIAQQRGIDLRRLYRWVAFERLLARLFAPATPPWVLKGGYALEVRFDNRAAPRSTWIWRLPIRRVGRRTLARMRKNPGRRSVTNICNRPPCML